MHKMTIVTVIVAGLLATLAVTAFTSVHVPQGSTSVSLKVGQCLRNYTAAAYPDHVSGHWTSGSECLQGRAHAVCQEPIGGPAHVFDGGWVVSQQNDTANCKSPYINVEKAAWQSRSGPGGAVTTCWFYDNGPIQTYCT